MVCCLCPTPRRSRTTRGSLRAAREEWAPAADGQQLSAVGTNTTAGGALRIVEGRGRFYLRSPAALLSSFTVSWPSDVQAGRGSLDLRRKHTGSGLIGLAVTGRRIGAWSRRTGAPEASATRPDPRSIRVRSASVLQAHEERPELHCRRPSAASSPPGSWPRSNGTEDWQ